MKPTPQLLDRILLEFSFVVWFCSVFIAVVLGILTVLIFVFYNEARFPHFPVAWILAIVVTIIRSTWIIFAHCRIYTTPKQVLSVPDKRFVLYLRPFRLDVGMMRTWLNLLARSLTFPSLRPPPAIEEQIADALRLLGRMVAIGRPFERFSHVGSDRYYFEAERWQSQVRLLLARCEAAVLVAGNSPGAICEQSQVREGCDPLRALMVFLAASKEERLESLRRSEGAMKLRFPQELADHPESLALVHFTDDWVPIVLPVHRRTFGRSLIAEEYIDMRATLRDFRYEMRRRRRTRRGIQAITD